MLKLEWRTPGAPGGVEVSLGVGPYRLRWRPVFMLRKFYLLELSPAHYGCSWLLAMPLGLSLSDHYRWRA